MKKIKWQYYFARKFSAHRYEIVMRVFFSSFYSRYFGVNLKNVLVAPEDRNHAIYMDSEEWTRAQKKIYNIVCKNWETFQKFNRVIKSTQRKFDLGTKEISKKVSPKLSNKQLLKLYCEAIELYQNFFNKPIWIPFPVEPILAEEAEKELNKVVKQLDQKEKLQEYFNIIFSPEKKNVVIREREDLLEIAIKAEKGKNIDKLIKRHWEKYKWIPCYDPVDKPWEMGDFKKELNETLKSLIPPEKELIDLKAKFKNRRKVFENFLKTIPISKAQKDLFRMAHEMCFIKDERDDYRRLGSFQLQQLYLEIGRRAGLSLKEVANCLISETEEFLKTGKFKNIEKIKERLNGYVLLRKDGSKIKVFSGKEAQKVAKQELSLLGKQQGVAQIKGIIGSQGRARGAVQVVVTKHDLRKVKKGDIMVAVTTHPDFVPAMRQAVAIITDEGGITCHAAIVSRELGIPCIIGTKIATKVLKDGDLIEVDATKGVVKILK